MEEILSMNVPLFNWDVRFSIEKWMFAHDDGRRYGSLTTNVNV